MKRRIGIYKDKILVEGAGTKVNKYEIAIEDISNTECNESTDSGGEDPVLYFKYDESVPYLSYLLEIGYTSDNLLSIKYDDDGVSCWTNLIGGSGSWKYVGFALSDTAIPSGFSELFPGINLCKAIDFIAIFMAINLEKITDRNEILSFISSFKEEISKYQISKEEYYEGKISNIEDLMNAALPQ